jgi:D-tyrosyl-tRNA(Tyr) deacylase
MKAVLQRVSQASVRVGGDLVAEIDAGFLVLAGAAHGDDAGTARVLASKIAHLRVFPDEAGRMNLSLLDISGAALVVSQFTLLADTRKGRRPSFVGAADPDAAEPVVDALTGALGELGIEVGTGVFGAHMEVSLVNDGPVTILLDTEADRA